MRVLTDSEVRSAATPADLLDVMRECLVAAATGRMGASPRVVLPVGRTDLTVGAGGLPGGPVGLRVYGGWGPGSDQLTAVWSGEGRLLCVVEGPTLGIVRTGALGGVAVDALARATSRRLGLVGCGRQGWSQVQAAVAVRPIDDVVVHSRRPEVREAFARRVTEELGIPCAASTSAQGAVEGRDVVIVATTATEPVVEADWIAPGTHVSTLGAKALGGAELPAALGARTDLVVSDSPAQLAADGGWFSARPVDHLGAVLAGRTAGRTADEQVSLFLSVGLTGTEAVAASTLLGRGDVGR